MVVNCRVSCMAICEHIVKSYVWCMVVYVLYAKREQ